jgi:hypothetical protein
LQAFCPLQSLRAVLHADWPLQVLTPKQLKVDSAAVAVLTAVSPNSSAAAVASATRVLIFDFMD